MTTTNLISEANVTALKFNVLSLVGDYRCMESMFEAIEIAMGHFVYTDELVETIVFSFLNSECSDKLEKMDSEFASAFYGA
jgi:hypothetical protein